MATINYLTCIQNVAIFHYPFNAHKILGKSRKPRADETPAMACIDVKMPAICHASQVSRAHLTHTHTTRTRGCTNSQQPDRAAAATTVGQRTYPRSIHVITVSLVNSTGSRVQRIDRLCVQGGWVRSSSKVRTGRGRNSSTSTMANAGGVGVWTVVADANNNTVCLFRKIVCDEVILTTNRFIQLGNIENIKSVNHTVPLVTVIDLKKRHLINEPQRSLLLTTELYDHM